MRKTLARTMEEPLRQAPRELVAVLGAAVALFAVIVTGGLIASVLPAKAHTPWLVMASYAAPAAVAFVIHWWVAQQQ